MDKIKFFLSWAALAAVLLGGGCMSAASTSNIKSVTNFKLDNYLGRWYEVARMPHSFERDMQKVSAVYTRRGDGKVNVFNSGWRDGKFKSVNGVARMAGADDVGELEVSFFGPFYGAYRIIALDENYQRAIVTGDTMNYLWILSRTPRMNPELLARDVAWLAQLGYDTAQLEYPQPLEAEVLPEAGDGLTE